MFSFRTKYYENKKDINIIENNFQTSNYEEFSKGNFSNYECSQFNLSLFLQYQTSSVFGNLSVKYYNNDLVNFTRIPFHLYVFGMHYEDRQGKIDIWNVTALNNPIVGMDYIVLPNKHLMWVNLTSELNPGHYTDFKIEFNVTLPDGLGRANDFGFDHNDSRIFKFSNCYPIPCVFDKYEGWNTEPYLTTGDPFYFDMAYYDLIINVPEDMIIAATGKLLERSSINSRKIWHFNPRYPVREITFSASKYFIIETTLFNGVNISTYFLNNPQSLSKWHNFALETGKLAIETCNNSFGIYPYKTFNIVEEYSHYGGMEYPLQIYISRALYDYYEWYFELAICHEAIHQWFYNLVGNDEIDCGILDEGITCWAQILLLNKTHPDWDFKDPTCGFDQVRNYFFNNGLPNKINQSIEDCPNTNTDYVYTAYRKMPTILEKLRRMIGHESFINSLNLYVRDNYFGIARLSNLQDTFEINTDSSLDWFFKPWFNNPFLPKYSFGSAIYNQDTKQLNITIEDLNRKNNPYPYCQKVPLKVFKGSLEIYSNLVWINGTTKISITLDDKPTRIRLSYSDKEDILVQLSSPYQSFIETSDIQGVQGDGGIIPGFDVYFIIITSITIILLVKKTQKFKLSIK